MESVTSENKNSYKQIFHEFMETTTINGLARVTLPNKSRSIIWGLIVLSVFVCFGIHFYVMLNNYLNYATNTQVVIEEGGFKFPDITICTLKPFSKEKTNENLLGIHNATQFWYHVLPSTDEKDIRRIKAEKLAQNSFRKFAYDEDIYVDLLDHVHLCLFKGIPCSSDDFSITRLPEKRNCFTYHPTDRFYSEINSGINRALVFLLDGGNGFDLKPKILKLMKYEGVEIIIHENGTRPNFNKKFLLQNGKFNEITLAMSKYTSLPTPVKHCRSETLAESWTWQIFSHNLKKKDFVHYRAGRDSCRERKIQEHFLNECKCWHDELLIPLSAVDNDTMSYPFCHELPAEYFYNEQVLNSTLKTGSKVYSLDEKINGDYMKIVQRYKCFLNASKSLIAYLRNISMDEDCNHLCDRVSYNSVLSVSDYSVNTEIYRDLYEDYIQKMRIKHKNKSLLEIDVDRPMIFLIITPIELDVSDTVESLAYPLSAFMSDFGGNIGLWIGCTVITVAEIFELIIRLSYLKIKRTVTMSKLNLNSNGKSTRDEA